MTVVRSRRHQRTLWSIETQLALAPGATYAWLLAEPRVPVWRRLGVILLVMAVAIPIMAVQRVTIGLVTVSAICWSFALAIQLVTGALIIASVPSRRIGLRPALGLWFAGHLPYSLWLLVTAALMANLSFGSLETVIALAVIPSVWTAVIVSAFCRVVLASSHAGARWRAAAHFFAVWTISLQYVAWGAGGWFQITSAIARPFH